MAVVYHAYDTANDRDVAIKVLSLDLSSEESFLARFQRESELMRDLNHPNILRAYDYGQENELVYLVMSYYGGGTLKERINRTPLPLATIADFLTQISNGLGYAHSRGIIHRDVKPSNVLLHHASDKLVLSDFGIAKALSNTNSNRTGTIMGTPLYMAPEQFLAGGDQRSDIYALGIVLYQMLTGEVPFKGENIGFKHMTDPVPPLRTFGLNYDAKIEAVVTRALAKRPEARYQKVEDLNRAFQEAVREYAQSETQQATPEMFVGDAFNNEGPSGILPGQDSLSAVPVVLPTTTPLAKIDTAEREAVRSSNPLLFQATDQASPVVVPATRNPVVNNPNGPTFPMPVNTGPVEPVPSNSRPYVPLQQSRSRPDLPVTRSRPLDEDDTGEFAVKPQRKKGANPLIALLAGVLVVLALGGVGLFFLLNNTNQATPPGTGGSLLPGGLTSTPAGAATTQKPSSPVPATTAPTSNGRPVTGALPRNMRLLFTSSDTNDSNKQNIFYYDPLTGQLKQLTNLDKDSGPVWSPSGNMIAFQRRRDGGTEQYDIWLMSADGSGQKKIVDQAHNPAFRNNGSEIVYYSEVDKDLYTKLVDGTNAAPVRLTNDGKPKYGPVYSPDDTKIAYAQEDETGISQIYVIDTKPGATPSQVTRCANFNCVWPTWSPDGKQLAFSTREKSPAGLGGEIWTIYLDGSRATAIVTQNNGGGHNSHPFWVQDNRSSTGTRIYFNSDRGEGNNARIYVTDPNGTNQQLFVKHPGPKGDNDAALQDYAVNIFLLGG
jgi:serine/threonine protein kinase/Tol biopolymer transport system component